MKGRLYLLPMAVMLMALMGTGCIFGGDDDPPGDDPNDDPVVVVPVVASSSIDGDELVTDLWGYHIGIEFNENMDETSLIAATSITYPGGARAEVDFNYTLLGKLYGIEINDDLNYDTEYTVTIGTGAESTAGEPMATAWIGTFTTIPENPIVMETSPADGATDVAINTSVMVIFSRYMDPASVMAALDIDPPAAYTTDVNGKTLMITFDGELDISTLYTITIDGSAQADWGGPIMGTDYIFSFTTGLTADETPPHIISYNPANGATGVSRDVGQLVITFSEPILDDSLEPEAMDPRLMMLMMHDEPDWDATGTILTVDLLRLPAGTELFVDLGPFMDLADNESDDPVEWSITVAGGVDWFPGGVNDMWAGYGYYEEIYPGDRDGYDFEKVISNINGSEFHLETWAYHEGPPVTGDREYEHESSEFFNKAAGWAMLTGSGHWDWDGETEIWGEQLFTPPVNWMPLDVSAGYTWNGVGTMDMDGDTADLSYAGTVVGFEDVLFDFYLRGENAASDHSWFGSENGDRFIEHMEIRDCAVVYLTHVVTTEIEVDPGEWETVTVHEGWDSIWYAPGVGLIKSHTHSVDEWDEDPGGNRETHISEHWEYIYEWLTGL